MPISGDTAKAVEGIKQRYIATATLITLLAVDWILTHLGALEGKGSAEHCKESKKSHHLEGS